MKRKRFTEEQIIGILREQEAGAKTADLARKHGVSEATLYNWKAKFGGMDVSDARRLKALEDENGKLKRLLAGLSGILCAGPVNIYWPMNRSPKITANWARASFHSRGARFQSAEA